MSNGSVDSSSSEAFGTLKAKFESLQIKSAPPVPRTFTVSSPGVPSPQVSSQSLTKGQPPVARQPDIQNAAQKPKSPQIPPKPLLYKQEDKLAFVRSTPDPDTQGVVLGKVKSNLKALNAEDASELNVNPSQKNLDVRMVDVNAIKQSPQTAHPFLNLMQSNVNKITENSAKVSPGENALKTTSLMEVKEPALAPQSVKAVPSVNAKADELQIFPLKVRQHEQQNNAGGIFVYSGPSTKKLIDSIRQSRLEGSPIVKGGLSPEIAGFLAQQAAVVLPALAAGNLWRMVGSPAVLQGLQSGQLSLMHSATGVGFLGSVTNTGGHQIVGNARWLPVHGGMAAIVAPTIIYSCLSALFQAHELGKINQRLDKLQRSVDRIGQRIEAGEQGEIFAACEGLDHILDEYSSTWDFSDDMKSRLNTLEQTVRKHIQRLNILTNQFKSRSSSAYKRAGDKTRLQTLSTLLKEEGQQVGRDMNLMMLLSKALLAIDMAHLLYYLQHDPSRLNFYQEKLAKDSIETKAAIASLPDLREIQREIPPLLDKLDFFTKNIFNRSLASDARIAGGMTLESADKPGSAQEVAADLLIWQDEDGVHVARTPQEDIRQQLKIEYLDDNDSDIDVEASLDAEEEALYGEEQNRQFGTMAGDNLQSAIKYVRSVYSNTVYKEGSDFHKSLCSTTFLFGWFGVDLTLLNNMPGMVCGRGKDPYAEYLRNCGFWVEDRGFVGTHKDDYINAMQDSPMPLLVQLRNDFNINITSLSPLFELVYHASRGFVATEEGTEVSRCSWNVVLAVERDYVTLFDGAQVVDFPMDLFRLLSDDPTFGHKACRFLVLSPPPDRV